MLRAIDPTNGTVVREVPIDSTDVVDRKLTAARDAFARWRTTSFDQRAALLRSIAARLRERRDQIADLMIEEMGKPVGEARGEVEKSAWCCEHYADKGASYLTPVVLQSDARKSYVQHLPLGSLLVVLPWNFPVWLAFRTAAPALMAGNVCVLKNDPHVPGCAVALAELFQGDAADLVQSLLIDTDSVESVLRDPRIAAVTLVGSTRAGQAVGAIAGSEVKPSVLELGGSDPCIVLADADLAEAARISARSRILNAGQSCIAAKRLLVEASVHDRFVELLRAELAGMRVGDPRDPATDVGPLARAELRDNLHRQVSASVAAGARCLLGGEVPDGPGCFYPITLLTEVTSEMPVFTEETFGPVAVVTRADDADHAIALANQTEYGLAASIWTEPDRGAALARDIEAGQVVVNGFVKTDPRLPSGGIKRSGYGRELGPQGILDLVNIQQVWVGPAPV